MPRTAEPELMASASRCIFPMVPSSVRTGMTALALQGLLAAARLTIPHCAVVYGHSLAHVAESRSDDALIVSKTLHKPMAD